MNWRKRILAAALSAVLLVCLTVTASAAGLTPETVLADTAECVLKRTPAPSVGTVGGEWAVLGLVRSGHALPEGYCERYYKEVEHYAAECGGVLSTAKYTEYARVSLALTAIGKDPRQVGGTDLLAPLGDYRKVVRQGANGAAWALIALDAGGYAVPEAPGTAVQATRQLYVDFLLESQLPEGGWSLGQTADPDLTGMALTALAPYRDQAAVTQAAEKALERMSALQGESGGFATAESAAQMLVALVAWDISPEDGRFVKNGHTLLDGLLADYLPGRGFRHTSAETEADPMATEQGLYALAAVCRARAGKPFLYDMTDVKPEPVSAETAASQAAAWGARTGLAACFWAVARI